MPAKVFISCGQSTPEERRIAEQIGQWFSVRGFLPYVAVETQTLIDLNSDLIAELRSSDYYLFVNFEREIVKGRAGDFFRGSVYTNQELAMAYALGFEKFIILNQKGTKAEGLHAFIVSNTPEFTDTDEVLNRVQMAAEKSRWSPSYSRNLMFEACDWTAPIQYGDHTGQYQLSVLEARILNNRPDAGASHTVARLSNITPADRERYPSPDRSPLKVAGQQGYSQTIWPKSTGRIAILAIDLEKPSDLYLNSALDVNPRQPIITNPGKYCLDYELYAVGFPPFSFSVELVATGEQSTTTAKHREAEPACEADGVKLRRQL